MRSISLQFKTVTPILLIVWLITILALLIAIYSSTVQDIALDSFTQDPNAQMNAPFYLGLFSNIGIMIWTASAMICLFTANRIKSNAIAKQFLLISALITLLMTLDDLFQLHEFVFPHYFAISSNMIYITYLNVYLIYFLRYKSQLLNSDFIIFGIAFFLLGLSTIIDILPLPIPKDTFLEDAIKLMGIATWFVYFFRLCNEQLDETV